MEVSLRCELVDDGIDRDVAADVLSAELFAHGATAVGEVAGDDEPFALIAGFVSEEEARKALKLIDDRHGGWLGESTISPASIEWARLQRDGLEPTQIGPWCIRTPWDPERLDIDSTYDIVIDPGVAFGHGAHPSTVMAIELMLHSAHRGGHLLDVGTGTAIISIIAARLGMSVTALESDAAAAEVAWLNIERNATFPHDEVKELIDLRLIDAATHRQPAATTLVVANVTIDVQRMVAPTMSTASTIIVSGILCRQVADVLRLYPEHDGRTIRTHGEWASIELRHHKRLSTRVNR